MHFIERVNTSDLQQSLLSIEQRYTVSAAACVQIGGECHKNIWYELWA